MSEDNYALGKRILEGSIKFIESKNNLDEWKEYMGDVFDVSITFDKEDLSTIIFDDRRSSDQKNDKALTSVSKIESKFPLTTTTFLNITKDMYMLFCIKQADYGPDNIGLGNDLSIPQNINLAILGLAVRMNDKVQRLLHLTRDGAIPNNESIEDTLLDIGNYAIITLIVKKGEWSK